MSATHDTDDDSGTATAMSEAAGSAGTGRTFMVVSIAVLLTVVFVPLTLWNGIAPPTDTVDAPLGKLDQRFGLFALGLLFGGAGVGIGAAGLVLRQAWGWWASVVFHGFFALLCLRMAAPLARLNWEHAKAQSVAFDLTLQWVLPAALAALAIGILFGRSMRETFGVSQRPYERHRPAIGRTGSARRARSTR